ncbi:MAG: membrane protein insertase YidC [Acidobacteriia bacterium]|nr:membrane protein insertase YidC [Terriglobia bacterium]
MNGSTQNPQQEPGMERRLLLVFILTFAVLLISQPLLMKYFKPPAQERKEQKAQPAATQPVAPAQAPAVPAAPVKAQPGAKAAAAKQATAERETVIENDLYKIVFTNRGAQVKSWILKKYDDDQGHPLELVHQVAAQQSGYPLSLWTYDEALRKKLSSALYVGSVFQLEILQGTNRGQELTRGSPIKAPATIAFEYSDADTTVRKRFRFDHSYVVKVETSVTQNGQPVRAYPAWPAGFGDQTTPASYASATVDLYNGETSWHGGEKVVREPIKKISSGATINGPFAWAGAADQYFGAVFMPDDPKTAVLVTLRNAIEVPKDPAKPEGEKIKQEVVGAAVGNVSGLTSERLFAGPKNLDVLQSVKAPALPGQAASNLEGMVDFGTYLGFIAKPLFLWLRWTFKHLVGNWGWSIIVLTVIINIVVFPLRLTSMKSALKMQKLQPQINAIKNRYSQKTKNLKPGDRAAKMEFSQQQNQEIAALFKREGASPMGGCIPMLIQFPFLVAFYSMLGSAIELRHAHWFWLHDLSSPDPVHILPILIIITTLAVQKMTPQAGMDPAQQKVMTLMMPVMLGIISWNLSSGLCLYWVMGNLVSIIQQFWMNNTKFGQEMRAEAEKRARKKGLAPTKT